MALSVSVLGGKTALPTELTFMLTKYRLKEQQSEHEAQRWPSVCRGGRTKPVDAESTNEMAEELVRDENLELEAELDANETAEELDRRLNAKVLVLFVRVSRSC